MHNLEIGSAGQVAFATRGKPAWHLLGETFPEDAKVTTQVMLKKASLNGWDVRLEEAQRQGRALRQQYEILRTNPFDGGTDSFGFVGDRYHVFQNEELFSLADDILDGGGIWESAGSIAGGTKVFGSLRITDADILIDEKGAADSVRMYLLVHTSHDGSVAIMGTVTPVRVVCQNTLDLAISGATQRFKFRHTASAKGKVVEAREALGITFAYAKQAAPEWNAMYQTSVTDAQFFDIVSSLYPKPDADKKGAMTRWENKIDAMTGIFKSSPPNDGPRTMDNITGTAWGAYNAMTEYLDWYRTGRGDNKQENLAAAASGFVPVVTNEKQRQYARVLDFVRENNPKVAV